MIAIAVVTLMSTVQIEARFGEPTSSVAGFDMPIKAGVFAVARGRTTVLPNGEVMLFVPRGSGAQLDREMTWGPVKHVRVRELPRGLAIVLTPRGEMEAADVRIVDGHLKAAPGAASAVIRDPEPVMRNPEEPRSAQPQTAKPQTAQPLTAQPQTAKPQTEQPLTAQPPPAKPHSPKPSSSSDSSPLRTMFTLTILLAAAAAAIIFNKKRQMQKLGHALDGIEVVSVKALGTKQRLAVIEVSGERMLIAASDQGLQLLSKLGDAPTREPPTQAQSLADFASALEDAQVQSPLELTHPKPKARRSADVAGLIKLRAASAWTLSDGELT